MFSPRQRVMPMVPEPFSGLSISKQSVFFRSRPMSAAWAKFCPNLNTPQYRDTLSDEKKTELDQRATKLSKRASCNYIYTSSEFCWEVSAWNDVFGLLYNDERFQMDKRPYEFLETDAAGNKTVKKRIPDATIGLKSYDDFFLKRGYFCTVVDCKDDHSTFQPDKRLSENDLRAMMYDPECGLVVDGAWGETDLLFPFAVYEAKKRANKYEQAEDQIYHACRTYLAMLDDLARNPDNVTEYQTEESSKYQLFAFTSCGPQWHVFVAWNMLNSCTIETIWEGKVTDFSRAFELICIVDQIQDYAVNHHRPFVMNHLEAWHARHKKTLQPIKRIVEDLHKADFYSADRSNNSPNPDGDLDMNDSDSSASSNLYDFDEIATFFDLNPKPAEWLRLKEWSKYARQKIANETRRRNRSHLGTKAPESPETRRPRGRPPKARATENEAGNDGAEQLRSKARPRGRPPKARVTENEAGSNGAEQLRKKARPRGRPPKVRITNEEAPKPRRGRPPKIANRTTLN